MAHEITEITMIYVFNSRADIDEEAITEVLPEGGEIMETLAKRLIEKGEARAEAKGEAKLLMRLITKKFPELDNKYYEKIKKLDLQQIEALSMALFDIKDSKELEEYL